MKNLQNIPFVVEASKLLGQFVIYGTYKIGRFIGIVYTDSPEDSDLYYVIFDGKKVIFDTCLSGIYPLKGCIQERAYEDMIRTAKLNHYDQEGCMSSPLPRDQFKAEVIGKLTKYDHWITPIVWDLI